MADDTREAPTEEQLERAILRLRILHQHCVRALDRQAAVLADLRTRAGTLLAATGIVTSLLGSAVLKTPRSGWIIVGVLALFAAGVLCCIMTLRPLRDTDSKDRRWQVTLPRARTAELAAEQGTEADLLWRIISTLNDARRTNYKTIRLLTYWFVGGAVLLVAQIIGWTLILVR